MHTTQIGKFTINHNGDFSGDVIIGPIGSFSWSYVTHGDFPEDGIRIEIPFDILEELVGIAYKDKMVGRIEDVSGQEFLNGYY